MRAAGHTPLPAIQLGGAFAWMQTMTLKRILLATAALLVAIQAVPYGRDHVNPPAREEPRWDHPRTRALAVRACFDCHSNETRWPWYASIAPASWLVQHDVDEGRGEINFSEWGRSQRNIAKLSKEVRKGDMPPLYYPWARLTADERAELARGLETLAASR